MHGRMDYVTFMARSKYEGLARHCRIQTERSLKHTHSRHLSPTCTHSRKQEYWSPVRGWKLMGQEVRRMFYSRLPLHCLQRKARPESCAHVNIRLQFSRKSMLRLNVVCYQVGAYPLLFCYYLCGSKRMLVPNQHPTQIRESPDAEIWLCRSNNSA